VRLHRPLLLSAIALIPLLSSRPLGGQMAASPITWTQQTLKSTALGTERRLFISLPQDYGWNRGRRYPVLLLLDAEDVEQFTAAVANARFLGSRDETPPLIIVGIPNGADRTHDLTPTAASPPLTQFPTAGGADHFLTFLADEVLPAVRQQYRTLPLAILAGHSFGGLFGAYAATRPTAFGAIIAMSPSLWWNNDSAAVRYADLVAHRTAPLRLFVSSGAYEPPIDRTTLRFAARLDSAKNPTVAFGHRRYVDDSHGLTPLPSLVDGLRFIFKPVSLASTPFNRFEPTGTPPDSTTVLAGLAEMQRRYAAGARSLGLPEDLPESAINGVGGLAIYFKQPGAALAILRRDVERFPESAMAYDGLGDALIAAGDTAGAVKAYRQAVTNAQQAGDPSGEAVAAKLRPLSAHR